MNLVYKQEVLNTLCDNCDTVQAVCPHYPCKRYTGIERLPSAQQWIPCSKELPPYGKHVLTWWKGVIAIDCRVPGYEDEWLLNVEAWMPLPEPYKAGGIITQ